MKKKLIFIFILLSVIFVSGCITSSLDNVNSLVDSASEDIASGDKNYNKSVIALNNKDYSLALDNVNKANDNFYKANDKINQCEKYYENLNQVWINYLDYVNFEIEHKINATDNLKLAIENYNDGNVSLANDYANIANKLIYESVELQQGRNDIVSRNPSLFKEDLHF